MTDSPANSPALRPGIENAISGYDLVSQVLGHPQGGVAALITLAAGHETEWLEFKAAMVGRPEDRKNPKEKDADGHWNVAEAVIALANSDGGSVLVGVDDNGHAVGLEAGDARKVIEKRGMDAFLREEVLHRLQPPDGKPPCWRTGVKGTWALERAFSQDQFSIEVDQLDETTIAVIRVKPIPAGGDCLIALQDGEERLIQRSRGNIGQCFAIKGRHGITQEEQSRCPGRPDYSRLWDLFLRRVHGAVDHDQELEAAIQQWHENLRKVCSELLTAFTPLNAEERFAEDLEESVVPRELFEPEAEEHPPDYLRDEFMDSLGLEDRDVEADDDEVAEPDRPIRRGRLFGLLDQELCAVVLGEPGGGKTTSLKRLALDDALAYEPGGRISLFLPLAKWQDSGGLWSLIRRITRFTPGQVEHLIRAGRCRLLLDALNECPDALRLAAINEIKGMLHDHPDLPVILSARTADTTQAFRLPTFVIEAMSKEQRRAFLRAYLHDSARADALLEQIEAQPGGESLAANPLLLRMIVEVARLESSLPTGRARLFRRWIGDWLERERLKAQQAGDPLPWTTETICRGLAAIAFASRKAGMRIVPKDLATQALEGLVEDPEDFLDRLAQGLILYLEEDHLEFRHETFQEYFCAEALLAEPATLDGCSPDAYATWGMPIAYAAELQDPLPQPLMASVWKISPWLAAAVSDAQSGMPVLPLPLAQLTDWFRTGHAPNNASESLRRPEWYSPDSTLRYAIQSSSSRHARWHHFEIAQLAAASQPAMTVPVLKRAITITPRSAQDAREGNRLPVQSWLELVKLKNGLVYRWLINFGVLVPDDFLPFRDRWRAKATPLQATDLVELGICTPTEFLAHRDSWVAHAKPNVLIRLIEAGICSRDDVAAQLEAWMACCSSVEAAALVKAGLCTRDDFAPRRLEWMATARPEQAAALVKAGLFTWDDFAARRPEWISTASVKQAAAWVKAGLFTRDDFAPRRPEWIATACPEQAAAWVKAGLFTRDDLAARRPVWISNASPKAAAAWVKAGLFTWDDFAPRKPEWIATARPEQAAAWVKAGLFTWDDFAPRKPEWIATARPEQAAALVKAGLFTWDDFAPRKPGWIATARPEQAAAWVKAGFFTWDDFAPRKPEWIATASPEQAAALVKARLFTWDDFAPKRPKWIATARPEQAATWVRAGIFTRDDFASRRPEWIAMASPKLAAAWVKAGLFTWDDFAHKNQKWIAKAKMEGNSRRPK